MSKKPRLLLVDDDPRLRRAASRVLSCAFHVTDAATVRDALEALAGETFEFLLTDLEMPGADGLALLDALAVHRSPLLGRAVVWTGRTLDGDEHHRGVPIVSKELPTADVVRLLLDRGAHAA